jgi:hypothetical protein
LENFKLSDRQLRHFCRNKNCRTKLAVPTDNHHKAFCCLDCYTRFYKRRCKVCEKELPVEASAQRNCCRSAKCRADFRKYRHIYVFRKVDERSAHFTGVKSGLCGPRLVAGPPLSAFSLWAATLPDPKPQKPVDRSWRLDRQPGDLAAEWTAFEMARREVEDAQYVAEDEERLRHLTIDYEQPPALWGDEESINLCASNSNP